MLPAARTSRQYRSRRGTIDFGGGKSLARASLRAGDPTRIGNYRLTARLGSGGMGVVYLGVGWDGGPVAVKVLRPELADDLEVRRRFRREVSVLMRVRGVCTVRVIEAHLPRTAAARPSAQAASPPRPGSLRPAVIWTPPSGPRPTERAARDRRRPDRGRQSRHHRAGPIRLCSDRHRLGPDPGRPAVRRPAVGKGSADRCALTCLDATIDL